MYVVILTAKIWRILAIYKFKPVAAQNTLFRAKAVRKPNVGGQGAPKPNI